MSTLPQDSTEKTALLGGEKGQPPAYSSPDAHNPLAAQVGYPATSAMTVVVTQPVVVQPVVFGDFPVVIVDREGRQVQTVLDYRTGGSTHLACFLLFLMGLIFHPLLCVCWVPYVTKSTKNVYHINPIDGTVVGVYKRQLFS